MEPASLAQSPLGVLTFIVVMGCASLYRATPFSLINIREEAGLVRERQARSKA